MAFPVSTSPPALQRRRLEPQSLRRSDGRRHQKGGAHDCARPEPVGPVPAWPAVPIRVTPVPARPARPIRVALVPAWPTRPIRVTPVSARPGARPVLSPDQPLSIADTIVDLGYTATLEEALEIGEAAAESYLTRHLQYPLFEHVRVNGAEYKNFFFKQIDRDLVIDEIQSYICDRDGLLGLGGARA